MANSRENLPMPDPRDANLPDLNKQLPERLGVDLVAGSPDGLQNWILGQIERWSKVVKDNNIKAD